MTDLKRLHDWHERQAHDWSDGVPGARSGPHAETARILSVLMRVREECELPLGIQPPIVRRHHRMTIWGPTDTLRDLAELLGGGS